jgi:hypothetical protein
MIRPSSNNFTNTRFGNTNTTKKPNEYKNPGDDSDNNFLKGDGIIPNNTS